MKLPADCGSKNKVTHEALEWRKIMEIEFVLNDENLRLEVDGDRKLLYLLRDVLGLTGTKMGCEIGECGACSVLIDSKLVKSCQVPVRGIAGKHITTIEGIQNQDGTPNDLQQAFLEFGAIQCGYCTPGMVLAGEALLAKNPQPGRLEIREAISDNLCRCTGYQQIVDAVESTARRRMESRVSERSKAA
jgi:carbon-monoxide dehydrogenase small subunit